MMDIESLKDRNKRATRRYFEAKKRQDREEKRYGKVEADAREMRRFNGHDANREFRGAYEY